MSVILRMQTDFLDFRPNFDEIQDPTSMSLSQAIDHNESNVAQGDHSAFETVNQTHFEKF